MSEASTQKLLVAVTCALGMAIVLIGYSRQRGRSFERLPIVSSPVAATRPTPPTIRPNWPTTNQRALSKASPSSAPWQSMPMTERAMNANPGAHASFYEKQNSIKDYFTQSAALESPTTTRHPAAQKLAQRNHQLQQRPRRAAPQPTNQPTLQSWPATQFHDFGNVEQTTATSPIPTQNSSAGHTVAELPTPEPDSFTIYNQFAHDEASPPAVRVLKTPPVSQRNQIKTAEHEEVASPLPRQLPEAEPRDIAAKLPAPELSPARFDRRVRKANWTEIEPLPKVELMNNFRPLEQPTLLGRHSNPQVEARAREQIKYGQSLARRRAYFAAREEFTRALLLIASSYNAASNSTAHPERLAQGLIAIDELGDFTRNNGPLLQQKILAHKSRLLTPPDIAAIQPMQAIGLYSHFAQSQIGQAINPANTVCINDLGVLLFNMGRLEESESTLLAALGSSQSQLSWNNLALVHSQRAANANSQEERSRQLSLAKQAAQQAEKFASHADNSQPNSNGLNSTQWSTPNEFQNNAAFPNVAIQHSGNRGPETTSKPGPSRSATLKQKMKDWF